MKRLAAPTELIMHLSLDLIIIICSKILQESFIDFCSFFRAWAPYHTADEISYLLHNISWSNVYQFEITWNQEQNQRFKSFVTSCSRAGVKNAICFSACKGLLRGNEPSQKLQVIKSISGNHHLSFLAFNIFNSVLNPSDTVECCSAIYLKLCTNPEFRDEFLVNCKTLRGFNKTWTGGWGYTTFKYPDDPLCPFYLSRSPLHFYPYGWPPCDEDMLRARCPLCLLQMIYYKMTSAY